MKETTRVDEQRQRERVMSRRYVQARLIERDSNFRRFALEHDYLPRTVTQVVERWAGRDELPQGMLTFRILRDLSRAIGEEVIPGILDEVA